MGPEVGPVGWAVAAGGHLHLAVEAMKVFMACQCIWDLKFYGWDSKRQGIHEGGGRRPPLWMDVWKLGICVWMGSYIGAVFMGSFNGGI